MWGGSTLALLLLIAVIWTKAARLGRRGGMDEDDVDAALRGSWGSPA
jgi:hypothetical protein